MKRAKTPRWLLSLAFLVQFISLICLAADVIKFAKDVVCAKDGPEPCCGWYLAMDGLTRRGINSLSDLPLDDSTCRLVVS